MISWLHVSGMSGWRNMSRAVKPALLLLPSVFLLSTKRLGMGP